MLDMGNERTQKRVRWPRARLERSVAPLLKMPVWAVAVTTAQKPVIQRVVRWIWDLWRLGQTSRPTLSVRDAVFVEIGGHEVSPLIEQWQVPMGRANER